MTSAMSDSRAFRHWSQQQGAAEQIEADIVLVAVGRKPIRKALV